MPEGPERTPDGRFVVIHGRRWRATDPLLPEDEAARLRRALMAARRAVGAALRAGSADAEREARARVHLAKTALGERGTPWWEQDEQQRRTRWEAGLAALEAPAGVARAPRSCDGLMTTPTRPGAHATSGQECPSAATDPGPEEAP